MFVPFQVYILIAFIATRIYEAALPSRRYADTEDYMVVIAGYAASFLVLIFGAFAELSLRRHKESVENFLFALLALFSPIFCCLLWHVHSHA
ncbi:MAG: hypothetical protein HY300_13090 [Verrucomicrobia bacterium]|nr:hypothetical protein [Verrucomicrobiota bacterium]